ncbi:hypothetical protein ACPPVT_18825 [Angustibacter sp. McL0619]|uniref:nSTAND1 domain-containing NTPase n=1 Tax=Angustibacter sp. McL0619 TaxID=3415676 RepID=UPI003CECAD7C
MAASSPAAPSKGGRFMDPTNPYVGPRPFNRDEYFYGRERDASSVVDSLLSGRVMLLHSQSGAGKTSLIHTSVVPSFEKRQFVICATTQPSFSALRVNLPPPAELSVRNRYVFSVVNGLIGEFTDRHVAAQMTLDEAIGQFVDRHGDKRRALIVIDQLEEVMTLDPSDVTGQTAFFEQLGQALEDRSRWLLLAIREDYVGALDRFRRFLPGQLRATFRLELLDERAALRAVQEPAKKVNITFEDDAAQALVNDLRLVQSTALDADGQKVRYPYIEPVLLQVVCYSLYRKLRNRQREKFTAITLKDVDDFRPFDRAISTFYRTIIDEVADGDRRTNQLLRDWVGHELIGKKGLRRQTRHKPLVADPDQALSGMQSRYLVRDDPRPGGMPLWELTHDRLVGPIIADNQAWRTKNLEWWQCLAEDWHVSDHDPRYLLRGTDYRSLHTGRRRELTETETAFLEASANASTADGRLALLRAQLGMLRVLVCVSLILNVVLAYWVLRGF